MDTTEMLARFQRLATEGGYEIRPLGMAGVDSGQLMVTDPCYLDGANAEWRESEFMGMKPDSGAQHSFEFSYDGACQATLSEKRGGQLHYRRGHPGAGVVFSSGYGDGAYQVLGLFNAEGRCLGVMIDMGIFEPEEDSDEMEE